MTNLPQDFIRKITQSLEEEEADIYTMMLYSINSDDLLYFQESDREEVRNIFKILMKDTQRHAELLKLILDLAA